MFFRFIQNPNSFLIFLLLKILGQHGFKPWLYCVAFWTLGNASCRRLQGMEPRLASRLDDKLGAWYRPQRCLAGLLLQGVLLQPLCCSCRHPAAPKLLLPPCSLWCSLLCDLPKVGSSLRSLLQLHLDKAKQPVSQTASTSQPISALWY